MEDLIKSIKAHLYDKAISPLFGTFAVSWLAWNYKFVLAFFSSLPINEKINYISTTLYPDFYSHLLQGALYPVITAIAFIYMYPYPAKLVYKHTRNKQKELREVKQKIEDETPLTLEESRKIRREIIHIEREYDDELHRKEEEIKRLKEIIYQNDSPRTPNSDIDPELPPQNNDKSYILNTEQLELLELIAKEDMQYEKNLIELSTPNKVKTAYNLGELVKYKLASVTYPNGNPAYSITHSGRTVLVKEGIVT